MIHISICLYDSTMHPVVAIIFSTINQMKNVASFTYCYNYSYNYLFKYKKENIASYHYSMQLNLNILLATKEDSQPVNL